MHTITHTHTHDHSPPSIPPPCIIPSTSCSDLAAFTILYILSVGLSENTDPLKREREREEKGRRKRKG